MCGIVGYLDKSGSPEASIGDILLRMLVTLSCRGPDSAGVAILGKSSAPNLILRIKLGERGNFKEKGRMVAERLERFVRVSEREVCSEYLRLMIEPMSELVELIRRVESVAEDLELVSVGSRLEVIKQVGSPANLQQSYQVGSLRGTHGIGHTRLSTESRVDLSHSQPFWAHGMADLATVHNGHITNYHKLRRRYEQRGIRFYTENDSEIIGIYLRDQMEHGCSFEQALRASMDDFDGSYCYLATNENTLAYVKDPFALKPLMVAESTEFVALATEEIALRSSLSDHFEVHEPPAGEVRTWSIPASTKETAHAGR